MCKLIFDAGPLITTCKFSVAGKLPDWKDATLVIDDHLAYLVSDRLGRRKRFLLDVIVDLVRADNLSAPLAASMVQAIRVRYPTAFVEHTLLALRR